MDRHAGRRATLSLGVVISHFGGVLLVQRDAAWHLPRVVQGWGESMPAAIERGVYEQTAIRVKAGDIIQAYDQISPDTDEHIICMDFEASYVSGDLSAGDQLADVAWASGMALRSMQVEENTKELLTEMGILKA